MLVALYNSIARIIDFVHIMNCFTSTHLLRSIHKGQMSKCGFSCLNGKSVLAMKFCLYNRYI